MSDYLMIGEVLKPQGIRGEVKIRPYAADVELFRSWKTLYLEEGGTYSPVSCKLSRIHEGFVYAVINGAETMEEAEKQRGLPLYVDRAHAAPLEDGAVYIADLTGCRAIDESGRELGILEDVLQHGSVDTWVFRGSRGVFMAPALKEAFPVVDVSEKIIQVNSARLEEVAVFED